jgi:Pyridoxal-phosphate dependent enzyme
VSVLDNIGRTRLVPLQHMVSKESARILLKLEYENPTGSMKDRMALAMVEAAESGWTAAAGGLGRRVHRRKHGGVARPGMRREAHPAPDRYVGRVQQGEAGPHDGARCAPHDCPEPQRRNDEGSDSR